MGFLVGLLTVVYFITCIVLVIVVLMQEPKGGGLSSAFGGAGLDAAFGASIGRKMSSFTVYLAIFFLILTIVLAILTKSGSDSISGSIMEGKGRSASPAGKIKEKAEQEKAKPAGEEPEKKTGSPSSSNQGNAGKTPPPETKKDVKPTHPPEEGATPPAGND